MSAPFYLSVALAKPLDKTFDYLPISGTQMSDYQAGLRVSVPFGNANEVGIIAEISGNTELPPHKIKAINRIIDTQPILPPDLMELVNWLHKYYHQPLGECFMTVLPGLLRKGLAAQPSEDWFYSANEITADAHLHRAPRQQELHSWLISKGPLEHKTITQAGYTPALLNALVDKSLANKFTRPSFKPRQGSGEETPLALNAEQALCLDKINAQKGYAAFLLEGITGSGKTEVYLQALAPYVAAKQQVLVLVPEIGLTPQTIARFEKRFDADILLLHSGLSDQQRLDAWLIARDHNGQRAQIIVGTRSAVFSPMPNLAAIIIDEEHDQSFKQQEGIRYHGRDVAVMRAAKRNVPIIMGSATPSLDSLQNALGGKYHHLRLNQRAGAAKPPQLHILNTRRLAMEHGLADSLLNDIETTLAQGNQAMVFINRRGFAPTLYCPDCGWISECKRCDARMTLHQKPAHLHCHHCDTKQALPRQCPNCLSHNIQAMGAGTERLETHLEYRFRNHPVIRVDRDSTQRKDSMETLLKPVRDGKPCILVGTQMLAKGHHFPQVTLVVLVNVDAGFFSADFRAMEKTAQLILQVSGRAGRGEDPGRAVIQTEFADHPLLHLLTEENYHALALALLEERKQQHLPPYGFQALLRADSPNPKEAEQCLYRFKETLQQHMQAGRYNAMQLLGPLPAPMELRAGRFRSQLWLRCANRKYLHEFIQLALPDIYQQKGFHKVRWSLDIDPSDNL